MSDEYIRKQDAVNAINDALKRVFTEHVGEGIINPLEPADVAPVVRCGQCGYWHGNDGDYGYCYAKDGQGFGHAWGENDFCSYGEREE